MPPPSPLLHILVVDDNRDIADSLVMVLSLLGHQATAVYSGQDALTADTAGRADVILLDLAMPRMSGNEVMLRLKADPINKDVPVIMITGNAKEARSQQSLGEGCLAVLPKPVEFPLLKALLHGVRPREG
jgi:CheY-like chemotaxis protein